MNREKAQAYHRINFNVNLEIKASKWKRWKTFYTLVLRSGS